jgi:hypothetical protein
MLLPSPSFEVTIFSQNDPVNIQEYTVSELKMSQSEQPQQRKLKNFIILTFFIFVPVYIGQILYLGGFLLSFISQRNP